MRKLSQIARTYLLSLGGGFVIFAVCSIFTTKIDYVKLIQAFAVASIVPNIANAFVIKYGVSKAETWLRRILVLMTYSISMTFFAVVFGLVENANKSLIRCAIMFVPEIIIYVILVLIAEDIQKKNLGKINEKLKENISKQEML